jgi:hypothetical protein
MVRADVIAELEQFQARDSSRTLGGVSSEVRQALLDQFDAMFENVGFDLVLTDLERKELLGMVTAFDIDHQLPVGFTQKYFALDDDIQQLIQVDNTERVRETAEKIRALLLTL